MNPLAWLRNAARNAVLGGIQDAVEQVGSDASVITVKVELPAIAAPTAAVEDQKSPPKKRQGA
jgi:hypothetical protein